MSGVHGNKISPNGYVCKKNTFRFGQTLTNHILEHLITRLFWYRLLNHAFYTVVIRSSGLSLLSRIAMHSIRCGSLLHILRGLSVCVTVSHSFVSRRTSEPTKIPFWVWTHGGQETWSGSHMRGHYAGKIILGQAQNC